MTHVTVSQDDLLLIQRALESLQDGTGSVTIDCHEGHIKQIRRQDAIKPTKRQIPPPPPPPHPVSLWEDERGRQRSQTTK
jgi:hypothetical protein